MFSKRTSKNYEVAFRQFLKYSQVDETLIPTIDRNELAGKIDQTFSQYAGNKNSILTKISACRNYIQTRFKIDLPSSKERKNLNKFKPRTTTKKKISKDDVDRVIQYFNERLKNSQEHHKVRNLRNLIFIKLLSGTGQRIGDILNLKVDNAKMLFLNIKQEKTGAEVTIQNPAIQEIFSYIKILGLNDNDYLFASGIRRLPIAYSYLNSLIQNATQDVLGKRLSPHTFRAYAITRLIELGYHPNDIKSISGHSGIGMIDYYNKHKGKIESLNKLLIGE